MNKIGSATKGNRKPGFAGLGPALLLALALEPWASHAQGRELPNPDGKTPPLASTTRAPGPLSIPGSGSKSGGGSSSDSDTSAAFRRCTKENPLNKVRCIHDLRKETQGGTLPGRAPGESGGGSGNEGGCYVNDDYVLIGHGYDEDFICFEEELTCYDAEYVEYALEINDGTCVVTPIGEPDTAGSEGDESDEEDEGSYDDYGDYGDNDEYGDYDEYGDSVYSNQGPGPSVDLEDIRSRIPGMSPDQEPGGLEEQSLQGEESNYDKLREFTH